MGLSDHKKDSSPRHQIPAFFIASDIEVCDITRSGLTRAALIQCPGRPKRQISSSKSWHTSQRLPENLASSIATGLPSITGVTLRSADKGIFPRPGTRDRASLSTKALLYLYLRRRCIHSDEEGLTKQVKHEQSTTFGTSQPRRRPQP